MTFHQAVICKQKAIFLTDSHWILNMETMRADLPSLCLTLNAILVLQPSGRHGLSQIILIYKFLWQLIFVHFLLPCRKQVLGYKAADKCITKTKPSFSVKTLSVVLLLIETNPRNTRQPKRYS